jgi:hypothetical protein
MKSPLALTRHVLSPPITPEVYHRLVSLTCSRTCPTQAFSTSTYPFDSYGIRLAWCRLHRRYESPVPKTCALRSAYRTEITSIPLCLYTFPNSRWHTTEMLPQHSQYPRDHKTLESTKTPRQNSRFPNRELHLEASILPKSLQPPEHQKCRVDTPAALESPMLHPVQKRPA